MMVEFPADLDYAAMVDSVLLRWSSEIEPGRPAEFQRAAWTQLEDLGLTRLTSAEDLGGSGAGWAEAATLHRLVGYHGVALPLAEHDLLAGWLCEQLELPLDSRVTSLAVRRLGDATPTVPYGRHAERVLVLTETGAQQWSLADLDAADLTWSHDLNLAAEPRDRITSSFVDRGNSVDARTVEEVRLRGALARSLQLSGALDQSVELATAHAAVREQFGRPLLKFQAVQALLADAAAETALAQAATLGAVISMSESSDAEERWRSVAVAKSCASHAAGIVCRNTHQVLGAIGFTTEHALHRYTGRLLAWRDEFGTRDEWDRELLEAVTTSVDRDLWSYVVGR